MFLQCHGACFVLSKINHGVIRHVVKVKYHVFLTFTFWCLNYFIFLGGLINVCISFTTNTMVKQSVANPLFICGYTLKNKGA